MQPRIDTSKPQTARMYDFYLGGKDHFAVEAGIRQFLDIGTGLPSANNVHEVAQSVAPECRVVYVDNDPIVLAHARALLTGEPAGRTAYIQADLRDPEKILGDPVTRQTLDFSQPVALMLVGVLHFVLDSEHPAQIVSTLVDALPPGSYLAASHSTDEYGPRRAKEKIEAVYRDRGVPIEFRSCDQFAEIAFPRLEMVEPGVVSVADWRPDSADPRPVPNEIAWNGAVGRKP